MASVYGGSVPLVRCVLGFKYRKIQFKGLENIPRSGGAVFVANHLRFEDSFLVGLGVWRAVHRPVTFGAKSEYFTGHWGGSLVGRFVKWYFEKGIHQVPVYRGARDAYQQLEAALKPVLKAGGLVVLHAEGTRSPDGKLYKFATGATRLARDPEHQVPLIPVALTYDDKTRTVIVEFGRPLHPKEHSTINIAEITRHLSERVRSMSKQVYEHVSALRKKEELAAEKLRTEEAMRHSHKQ